MSNSMPCMESIVWTAFLSFWSPIRERIYSHCDAYGDMIPTEIPLLFIITVPSLGTISSQIYFASQTFL